MKKITHARDSLYPDILFHFSDKDGLFGVLESTFNVSYAREKIIGKNNEREIGVPMVSFCDLKLSELGLHMEKYGRYGIGLTKEWANRNGLNPVLYISRYSPFTDGLLSGLDSIHQHKSKLDMSGEGASISAVYMNIYNTYRFIKNYEGPLLREGEEKIENYRYADEREWRYVPPLEMPNLIPFVAITHIKTKSLKNSLNETIRHIKLSFKPEDIRYLIVEKDSDILELVEHIRGVNGNYNNETLTRLASRILTADQINKDI